MEDPKRFTISFCKHKDLLSQWITYARESGVCIEMRFEESKEKTFRLYGKTDQSDTGKKERTIKIQNKPREIFYFTKERQMERQEEYKETAFRLLDFIFSDYENGDSLQEYLPGRWEPSSVFVKQYDFYQEEEYRLSFDIMKNPQIGYRTDKHVLKPYLDVECEDGWPIYSVMVGPGFNQEIVYNSVKYFLNHEKIKTSLLITVQQWKEHILGYMKNSKKILQEWNAWKAEDTPADLKQQNCFAFFDFLEHLTDEDIEPAGLHQLYRKTHGIIKEYPDPYFIKHYFTMSGIILEKSMIPYIF